jgi:hypothetical protein
MWSRLLLVLVWVPATVSLDCCERWVAHEQKDMTWAVALEAKFPCPCFEKEVGPSWASEYNFFREWTYFWSLDKYHPGAKSCFRSKPFQGHTQQCCYSDSGQLITNGPGGGTADKGGAASLYKVLIGTSEHVRADVKPFVDCGGPTGWDKYRLVRPISKGVGGACASNHGGALPYHTPYSPRVVDHAEECATSLEL